MGCALLVLVVMHESRAWRGLVWDVLHAPGIAEHQSLRELVMDIIKIIREAGFGRR